MVQVTNAPEGRTYYIKSQEMDPDIVSGKKQRTGFEYAPGLHYESGADYVTVETPYVVPNGKWVMERFNTGYGWSWLVGITYDEVERVVLESGVGGSGISWSHTLYVSDKPFGFIEAEDGKRIYGEDRAVPVGPRRLAYAQQIHKGELGQSVPTPRLKYVRADDKKRGNGWVRLTDLAAAAGLTPEDIVFGFWQYSGHRNYSSYNNDQNGGQLMDVVLAASDDEIRHQCPRVRSITRQRAEGYLSLFNLGDDQELIWVRRDFAYTVLRLLALGVRPEVTQPV